MSRAMKRRDRLPAVLLDRPLLVDHAVSHVEVFDAAGLPPSPSVQDRPETGSQGRVGASVEDLVVEGRGLRAPREVLPERSRLLVKPSLPCGRAVPSAGDLPVVQVRPVPDAPEEPLVADEVLHPGVGAGGRRRARVPGDDHRLGEEPGAGQRLDEAPPVRAAGRPPRPAGQQLAERGARTRQQGGVRRPRRHEVGRPRGERRGAVVEEERRVEEGERRREIAGLVAHDRQEERPRLGGPLPSGPLEGSRLPLPRDGHLLLDEGEREGNRRRTPVGLRLGDAERGPRRGPRRPETPEAPLHPGQEEERRDLLHRVRGERRQPGACGSGVAVDPPGDPRQLFAGLVAVPLRRRGRRGNRREASLRLLEAPEAGDAERFLQLGGRDLGRRRPRSGRGEGSRRGRARRTAGRGPA